MAILSKRRVARLAAIQCLYSWDLNPQAPQDIFYQFLEFHAQNQSDLKIDNDFFRNLFFHTVSSINSVDSEIAKYSSRELKQLDSIVLAILRVATYELTSGTTKPAIAIDEAIEITKSIAGTGSYSFVNSILDKIRKNKSENEFPDLNV
ncbi:transcription antitermination factor NusB [Psittacicella melopsittaci]|uniref:Transcription antitermination factor NusB n=1 Tax=Psittacicella melopsittaci TaxID=2028576 RepID=A0A3A1Y2H1_9GAMM|nr:transcription antitermination factor NusB [Psittacicella melopsittaci]RIY32522.1 transcription antitermination factor NusB [Psittacicella melopsittaci]